MSSVAAAGIFMLTTTLVICGCWFCHANQNKGSSGKATENRSQQQMVGESCPIAAVHVYEQVCIGEYDQEQLQAIGLTDNIAYVSTHQITKTEN